MSIVVIGSVKAPGARELERGKAQAAVDAQFTEVNEQSAVACNAAPPTRSRPWHEFTE
uniref:hypothetical protein n=1 Tax=Pseudomonas sp. RW407 TaxID=2202894 RepID=UPI001313EDA2|nr:hypothetical protein [Pseudomonas sp. RW407]